MEHDFSQTENDAIVASDSPDGRSRVAMPGELQSLLASLGKWMKFAGVGVAFCFGLIALVFSTRVFSSLAEGSYAAAFVVLVAVAMMVVFAVQGYLMISASEYFRDSQVDADEANEYLVSAFSKLRSVFAIELLAGVGFCLLGFASVIVVFWGR